MPDVISGRLMQTDGCGKLLSRHAWWRSGRVARCLRSWLQKTTDSVSIVLLNGFEVKLLYRIYIAFPSVRPPHQRWLVASASTKNWSNDRLMRAKRPFIVAFAHLPRPHRCCSCNNTCLRETTCERLSELVSPHVASGLSHHHHHQHSYRGLNNVNYCKDHRCADCV